MGGHVGGHVGGRMGGSRFHQVFNGVSPIVTATAISGSPHSRVADACGVSSLEVVASGTRTAASPLVGVISLFSSIILGILG